MKQAHIPILKSFDELKFNLGRKTFVDFVKGDVNPTIERNNLDELNSYGCLFMIGKHEIYKLIDLLIEEDYICKKVVNGGFEVIDRTSKGLKETIVREFKPGEVKVKSLKRDSMFEKTIITSQDKKLFDTFSFFLEKYNDEQKKAIISVNKSILCVAGAGSGKTTVLVKRIEFLKKFRGIKENKILAITFTRKAKEEMKERLHELGILNVNVETFNSFCEKMLKKYGDKIYLRDTKVAGFGDKIKIVKEAMNKEGIRFENVVDNYFTKKQIREKTPDELFFIFVNDVFTIIDFYKNSKDDLKEFYNRETDSVKKNIAKQIYKVAKYTKEKLVKSGLRDFTDQITDCLRLFENNKDIIPKFDHVLVDEFQDVNKIQVDLLKIFNSQNIFAVGDPRQAIYGWRGSDVEYILNFPKDFKDCEVIQLKKNYRSTKTIVDFSNLIIKDLGLENLESHQDDKESPSIVLNEESSELLEKKFVLESIKKSKTPRNEIFVLARTNRILEGYADFFSKNNVKYTIKSEEEYKSGEPKDDEIVLATAHSIKGMQAEDVYVVSCNNLSFPNKVQDNFVLALVKEDNDYDKESEELRLLYVACSRAKTNLSISYTGNYSKFISDEALNLTNFQSKNKSLFDYAKDYKKMDSQNSGILKNMLKDWRNTKAKNSGLPLYMIISNIAIDELARRRPQTKMELHQINGLGDVKIAKYGDELLHILGH